MAKLVIRLFLIISMYSGFLTYSANAGVIPPPDPDQCAFFVFKTAPIGGVPFDFIRNVNGEESEVTIESNTDVIPDIVYVLQGGTATFTELPQEGWVLQDIDCLSGPGISTTQTEDSVTFYCDLPSGDSTIAFCRFFNRVSADKIPTLSEWGMIAAAAGLGLVGVFFAVRRRRAAAGL